MLHYVQHDKMIGDQKFSDNLPLNIKKITDNSK